MYIYTPMDVSNKGMYAYDTNIMIRILYIYALYYRVKYVHDVIIVVVHVFFLISYMFIHPNMHDMYTYMHTYTKHRYMYIFKYMIVCASVNICIYVQETCIYIQNIYTYYIYNDYDIVLHQNQQHQTHTHTNKNK